MQKKLIAAGVLVALAASLTGCASESKTVTLATHDSFVISNEQLASFKKETGLTLKVLKLGDAGALTNKLILTQAAPLADAFFGIDNTFESAAVAAYVVEGNSEGLSSIDFGDVCLNYDTYYFNEHKLAAPKDFTELTQPKYRGLTVLENPASSSPGLAFLATTVAEYGDPGYLDYWNALKKNGVKIAASWDDAYFVDFSGSSGRGKYPIVLSYSTSPAYEVRADGKPQTASINEKCFRQTEFAGVLQNAKNPNNAQKVIDYLKSDEFQNGIAESMYVYPAVTYPAGIPADWQQFGTKANSTIGENLDFAKDRKNWIDNFVSIFG